MPKLRKRDTWLDCVNEPFNWCDRRCQRCPLASNCPTPAREVGRTTLTPDALDAARRALGEHAVRFDAAAIALPSKLMDQVVQLREASLLLCESFGRRACSPARSELASEALDLVFLVATKSVRIARHLAARGDGVRRRRDSALNLLLLAELKSTLREKLLQLAPELDVETQRHTQSALDDWEHILERLLELLDVRFKLLLDSLVQAGVAPSPFCRNAQGA